MVLSASLSFELKIRGGFMYYGLAYVIIYPGHLDFTFQGVISISLHAYPSSLYQQGWP